MRVRWPLLGLLLIGSLPGPGCLATRRSVNLDTLNPPYRIENRSPRNPAENRPDVKVVTDRVVAQGSKDEQAITRWLQAHETGWRLDFNSYVPGQQIKGDRFELNFVGPICVMNYAAEGKGDRWVQVSRTVEESDALPELFDR